MIRWFKKYFVPHRRNNHHPHLLRVEVMAFILGLVICGEITFLYSIIVVLPKTDYFALILSNVLVDSTNSEREKLSENLLTVNPLLQKAAQMKADDMATKGYFAHTSPEGLSPWYWVERSGYTYSHAGENLAVNFVDSQDVHNAWMASPGHKANIVNDRYTEIGIATANGIYKDREAIFVVQFFGRPALAKTVTNRTTAIIAPTSIPSKVITQNTTPREAVAIVNSETDVISDGDLLGQGASAPVAYSTLQDRIISEPRGFVGGILIVILSAFALALTLTIFVRNGVLKTRAIFNGAIAIAVIIVFLLSNQYFGTLNAAIF